MVINNRHWTLHSQHRGEVSVEKGALPSLPALSVRECDLQLAAVDRSRLAAQIENQRGSLTEIRRAKLFLGRFLQFEEQRTRVVDECGLGPGICHRE